MISVFGVRCLIIVLAEQPVLNIIRHAHGAGFLHGGRRGCLKGTREAIIGEVDLWTRAFDKSPVFWLNGLAGTGKSAIAQSVAETTFAGGQLGASFFCSRYFKDLSDLRLIFPTLAFQLAHAYPAFRSKLVRAVQSDPQIMDDSLHNQMDQLLVQPLKSSGISTVIIIDGLDECKDEQPTSAILTVLEKFIGEIPKVKFFIASRPEPWIRSGFRLPLMAKAAHVSVLHTVEPNLINSDIRRFLNSRLMELVNRQGGSSQSPTEEDLSTLCQRAGGLFVYAAETAKFLDHKGSTLRERLDLLLESPESSVHERDTTLDSLYTTILREALEGTDAEVDRKVRSVLGAVVLTASPLSPSTIATLLGMHVDVVLHLLTSVQSLLILHDDPTHPVRPFHKSFPAFITDSTRCLNKRFHVSVPDHQTELLACCLGFMVQGLERNVCKLPDETTNSRIDGLQCRINPCTNYALQYACRSWYKHLTGAGQEASHASTIVPTIQRFLEEKFIVYLETLSTLCSARDAVHALAATRKWLNEVRSVSPLNIRLVLTRNRQVSRGSLGSSTTVTGSSPGFSTSYPNPPPIYASPRWS